MIPFSDRLGLLKPSAIRHFTNLSKTVDDCVLFTLGEPDFATPENIRASAVEALDNDRTHYAPNAGSTALRRALAHWETQRGFPVKPEQVLVTIGATQALFVAVLGILNPGDEVIIPIPAYPMYENLVLLAGGKPVLLDISKTDFQIRESDLDACLSEKTKAILLCSPGNPTGTVLSEATLKMVERKVLDKNIFLIWDNVYHQLAYSRCPDLCHFPALWDQLIVCQSFSKPYAMTGWRVGYLIAPEYVMQHLLLLHAAVVAAVPTFVQDACLEALKTDPAPMREEYRLRRDYVLGRLEAMGLSCPRPEGAFYVFPNIAKFGLSSEEFCTRLILEGRVATVPGSCFGVEGHIRLSYCCSRENLKKGLDRLEAFLKTL